MAFGFRDRERGRNAPAPVLEHGARRGGMRRREKRQDEQVGVPEDMATIGVARESARAHCRLAAIGDRCHQMEEREAHLELQLLVTVDRDVGALPAPRPRAAMLGQQRVEPARSRGREVARRPFGLGPALAHDVRRNPIEPMPHRVAASPRR